MRSLYIHRYEGVGDHGFKYVESEGPLLGMLAVLRTLADRHGIDVVDSHADSLACGPLDGNIAWVNDSLGYSVNTDPHPED